MYEQEEGFGKQKASCYVLVNKQILRKKTAITKHRSATSKWCICELTWVQCFILNNFSHIIENRIIDLQHTDMRLATSQPNILTTRGGVFDVKADTV